MPDEPIWLTLAHSPDPDDVFMWWPLGSRDVMPAFDTGRFRFEPLADDIQALNRRAINPGDLDVTAISIHTYPHVRDRYRLTDCAGSFGEGYGPKIVVREGSDAPRAGLHEAAQWLRAPGRRVAVPGAQTTAFLTYCLMLGRRAAEVERVEAVFHEIVGVVARGEADAGLLIHDAQLTYREAGLREIADLGAWWLADTGLPLPLGGNAVRRDLDARYGAGSLQEVGRLLARSVRHAVEHREEGLARIRGMTLGLDRATLDRYLDMYVSGLTVSAGEAGCRAIQLLLDRGRAAGLCPEAGRIDPL